MKRAARCFAWGAVVLLVATAALALLAPCFGFGIDIVFSGSMEPELKVGSVVITRPVDSEDIEAGDVIAFRSPHNGTLMSHRVIAVEQNIAHPLIS